MFEFVLDGKDVNGLVFSLFAILMVFTVLVVIIAITSFISYLINKLTKKEVIKEVKEERKVAKNLNIEDDDMMVAVLIASIDYQNEIKQDVRLTNVRRIK